MSTPLYIIAKEISLVTYEHLRYIRFDLDTGKGFCYRSRVSYDYFAHGLKNRNKKPGKLMYICEHEDELKGFGRIDPAIPLIDVPNLWEFYKFIGYDYKKQKWSL